MACHIEFVTTNAASRISVFPLTGSGICGVGIEVTAQLASQIGNPGEDPASKDIAFDPGEPQFDLIEKGREGGGEVEMNPPILLISLL